MKSISLSLAVVALVVVSTAVQAQSIAISTNADGNFVVDTAGATYDVPGLDLKSPGGNLKPGTSAAPWAFFLANTPNQVAYGSLGTKVTLDGSLQLDSGYNGALPGDLATDWGNADANAVTSVTPTVPEPSCGILASLAGLALLGFRRRS